MVHYCPHVRNVKTKAIRNEITCSATSIRQRAELVLDIRPPEFHHISAVAPEKTLCTSICVPGQHMEKRETQKQVLAPLQKWKIS